MKDELQALFRMAIMGRPDAAEKLADFIVDNFEPKKQVETVVVEVKKPTRKKAE